MRLCIRRKNWNVSHTITNWKNLIVRCFVSIMQQNGIGSNSCGPEVQEKYQLDEEQLEFGVELILQL